MAVHWSVPTVGIVAVSILVPIIEAFPRFNRKLTEEGHVWIGVGGSFQQLGVLFLV